MQQTCHRRLWNPIYNFLNALPYAEVLTLDCVSSTNPSAGKYLSVTLPQYVTQTYLRKVSFRVGTYIDGKFRDYSSSAEMRNVIGYASFVCVCSPQRPEYLLKGLSDSDTPRRELVDTRDESIIRTVYLADNDGEKEHAFTSSVTQAFYVDSKLQEISYGNEYGLKLDYSDIVVYDYQWNALPTDYVLNNQADMVFEVTYLIDDLGLPREMEDTLQEYGFDLSYCNIDEGLSSVVDLHVQVFSLEYSCPTDTTALFTTNYFLKLSGDILYYLYSSSDNKGKCKLVSGQGSIYEINDDFGSVSVIDDVYQLQVTISNTTNQLMRGRTLLYTYSL